MLFPLCGGGGTPRLRLLPAGCRTIEASRRSSVGPLRQPMDVSMRQSFLPPSVMSITSENGGGGSLRPPVAAWISSSGGGGGSHEPWGLSCGTSHSTGAVCCARKSGDAERDSRLFYHILLAVINRIVMESSYSVSTTICGFNRRVRMAWFAMVYCSCSFDRLSFSFNTFVSCKN
jgi:hypothetical protein